MPPSKVLFISPNRIGDSVMASGIVREILRQRPDARITVVAGGPPAAFFRSAPGVERIIGIDKARFKMHWPRLWAKIVGRRWDLVVDTRGSLVSRLILAKERRVYSRALRGEGPQVEMITRVMQAPQVLEPELFIDDEARRAAAAVIDPQLADGPGPGPILALAPIAVQPGKSWPADRWGQLVERLKADPRFAGWRFMLVGGPGDHAPAAPALAAAGASGIDMVGKGDILTSAAAITRATLFVGNDSGLMHVAAAAGTPTLGLFGPTQWWIYSPRGPRTQTVAANAQEGEYAPIEDLTVERVYDAVLTLRERFAADAGA